MIRIVRSAVVIRKGKDIYVAENKFKNKVNRTINGKEIKENDFRKAFVDYEQMLMVNEIEMNNLIPERTLTINNGTSILELAQTFKGTYRIKLDCDEEIPMNELTYERMFELFM